MSSISSLQVARSICVNEDGGVVAVDISPGAVIGNTVGGKLCFHIQLMLQAVDVFVSRVGVCRTGQEPEQKPEQEHAEEDAGSKAGEADFEGAAHGKWGL